MVDDLKPVKSFSIGLDGSPDLAAAQKVGVRGRGWGWVWVGGGGGGVRGCMRVVVGGGVGWGVVWVD